MSVTSFRRRISSGDIAPSTYAVVRSDIVFLLCCSCYQYALTKHCEVKVLNGCGGKLWCFAKPCILTGTLHLINIKVMTVNGMSQSFGKDLFIGII